MSLLVLSAGDVGAVVSDLRSTDLETLAAAVFHTLSSSSSSSSPHRTSIPMTAHTALVMPSRAPDLGGTAIKVVSVPHTRQAGRGGLPASTLVLDESTGCVKAIVNATVLTPLRTAAGSVLATRLLLARSNTPPKSLVAFGAGKQTHAHVHLHLSAFPSFESCTIVNRSQNSRLRELASSLCTLHPPVVFHVLTSDSDDHDNYDEERLESAVRNADVICTATPSQHPLFPSEWVSPGTHLNLVGSFAPHMREVDSDLVRRARIVVVDSRDACAADAPGELISVGETSLVELGELVRTVGDGTLTPQAVAVDHAHERLRDVRRASASDVSPPRDEDVTIFKSVGVGIQDVAIADLILSRAERMGYGTRIENYHA